MLSAILPNIPWTLGSDEPIGLFVHRITPARQSLDYGKSKLAVGWSEVGEVRRTLEKLAKPWIKHRMAREKGKMAPMPAAPKPKRVIWRFLRAQRIDLAGRRSWCLSSDPEFVAKAADIVGLDLAPPDHAIVLAVDEKPAIQALERAQGYLKLPNGRSLHGQAHEYRRRGTTTLFAALEVATGQIKAKHSKRRRRAEFLDFMNEVVADYPDQEIHVVLDNLRTHKPKRDRWRARHKNVHFHFTPTHASWLNQVEIWFSILARSTLKGASSPRGGTCAKPSTPLSPPTTRPSPHSNGARPRPNPKTLLHGSLIYDS